jgi:putative holliday junction resolvase
LGRYLSIDYGTKRCGIAVTDPLRIIASGIDTVASHELMIYLEGYFKKEDVECVVVGKPMQMDDTPSQSFIHVQRFVQAFKKRFPEMRVAWMDERFSSKMAVQAMVDGGMKLKERKKKENIDKISAAIILQSFMEEENNNSE